MEFVDGALRILIVDDDEVDRMTFHRVLQKTNLPVANVHEATCGREAVETLQVAPYDCVFLDYRLPDLDGLELIYRIREVGISLPLIALTGQGDQETAVQFMKAGASDYLVKSSLNSDLMAQCIRGALRVYSAEKAVERARQQIQLTNAMLLQQNQAVEEHRRQIQRQNIEVMRASRLKSEFLATLSHELKTPLNAIIGFSQVLKRRREDIWTEPQGEMVNRIHSNARSLLDLLNEILDFSRLDAQRLELKPEPMNLAALVDDIATEMRSLADQKALLIDLDIQLDQPIVYNDPSRLRQIFNNLLSNAIKFTETGIVRVAVSSSLSDEITLVVADTGVGMALEEIDYIFEAFRQVDQTDTRRHKGTGLGLAIVDSLVTLMGGRIEVESQPGCGTTFHVCLPRQVKTSL